MTDMFPKKNGQLELTVGPWWLRKQIVIHGGPYASAYAPSDNSFGVVLVERPRDMARDLHMPIDDFSTPKQDKVFVQSVVKEILSQAVAGKDVFVGCMGGWGRTGLVLSLVAKAAGVEDPVAYVRENYTPKAVETTAQERYVEQFDLDTDDRWLWKPILKADHPILYRLFGWLL